jgi:hypothetical protein
LEIKLNLIEVVFGKAETKGPFHRPWGRWENTVKTNVKK